MAVQIQASAEYFGQWCQREAQRHGKLATAASTNGEHRRATEERMVSSAFYLAAAEWERYQRMGAAYTPSVTVD